MSPSCSRLNEPMSSAYIPLHLRQIVARQSRGRHTNLLDAEPVTQNAVQLRNPYVDPLNYIQVEMLRRIRALADPESEEAQSIREVIGVTVNGIAAGLRNTG